MFLLRRPASQQITCFLDASRALPLSYQPEGLVRAGAGGFRVDEQIVPVGSGAAAFARAVTALMEWHFELGWVQLCRVLDSTGEGGGPTFGFAYGTLTNHAESGEELFEISFDRHSGEVSYRIRAVSRPRATLARLAAPYTRLLQARFRRESAHAVRRAIDAR